MLFFKKKDYKTAVIKVYGMKCGMCETHINDIVRKNFDIKSVKASHTKNEVTIKYYSARLSYRPPEHTEPISG